MLEKLVLLKQDDEEYLSHAKVYGGYNDKPPNWTEITASEFARSKFFTYNFTKYEFRQFQDPEHNKGYMGFQSAKLFYMPFNDGYGMYNHRGEVRYFRFGCEHKWRAVTPEECHKRKILHFGRNFSVVECELCGYINSYDSSD